MGPQECFHWHYLMCTTFSLSEVHLKGKVGPDLIADVCNWRGVCFGVSYGLRLTIWLMIFSLKRLASDLDQPFQPFRSSQTMFRIRLPALTLALA